MIMSTRIEELTKAIEYSLKLDEATTLPESVFTIEGYSGRLYKQFINRLLSHPIVNNYLEIGVWKGSTAVAALYGNNSKISHWVIDNWNMDKTSKDTFVKNFETHIGCKPNLIEADCFAIDLDKEGIKDVDVYFYDGEHEKEDHKKSLTYYYDSMKDQFIFIVDDWSWDKVQLGTYNAISELNLKIEVFAEAIDSNNPNGWWNGCGIFILSKQ